MRHQSVTLTMDTYGYLFSGQEADAVARMLVEHPSEAKVLRSTGTDDQMAEATKGAQRQAQRAKGGEAVQKGKYRRDTTEYTQAFANCRLRRCCAK